MLTAVSNVSFAIKTGDPLVRQPDHGSDIAIGHSFHDICSRSGPS